VASGLPWSFEPVEREVILRVGENRLAFYRVKNLSNETLTGTATFNVTPAEAGAHFMKVHCFCFEEQTLKPGEIVDMPVSFFIDGGMLKDRDSQDLREITLSYTFFKVKRAEDGVAKSAKLSAGAT
jgi:cytochrome c oxidase assembly protein subunit 11